MKLSKSKLIMVVTFASLLSAVTFADESHASHEDVEPDSENFVAAPAAVVCSCSCIANERVAIHFANEHQYSDTVLLCSSSRPSTEVRATTLYGSIEQWRTLNDRDKKWNFEIAVTVNECGQFHGLTCSGWVYEYNQYTPRRDESVYVPTSRTGRIRNCERTTGIR